MYLHLGMANIILVHHVQNFQTLFHTFQKLLLFFLFYNFRKKLQYIFNKLKHHASNVFFTFPELENILINPVPAKHLLEHDPSTPGRSWSQSQP